MILKIGLCPHHGMLPKVKNKLILTWFMKLNSGLLNFLMVFGTKMN